MAIKIRFSKVFKYTRLSGIVYNGDDNEMALYEKFAKRLKDDLNIKIDPSSIKRTYVNSVLTDQGAWVWYGSLLDSSIIVIGSCQSISSLMKSNKIEITNRYNLEIEIGSLDD